MGRIFVVLERQVFIFEETHVFQVICVDIYKYHKVVHVSPISLSQAPVLFQRLRS